MSVCLLRSSVQTNLTAVYDSGFKLIVPHSHSAWLVFFSFPSLKLDHVKTKRIEAAFLLISILHCWVISDKASNRTHAFSNFHSSVMLFHCSSRAPRSFTFLTAVQTQHFQPHMFRTDNQHKVCRSSTDIVQMNSLFDLKLFRLSGSSLCLSIKLHNLLQKGISRIPNNCKWS